MLLDNEGEIADDFAEKNEKNAVPDPKNPEHWKRQPMSQQEIADRIGLSSAWVSKCIAIYKAPPEIRDMLESEKIAAPVAEQARLLADKHHKGSDAKATAICRRAYAKAREDNKDTATKKHFDAIKAEFIPAKKLVADGKEEKDEAQDKGDGADNNPPAGKKDAGKDNTPELPGDDASEPPAKDEEAENLFKQQTSEILEEGSKKNKKLVAAIATFLTDDEALEKINVTMTLNPEEAEALAEALVKIVHNAATVF